MSSPPLTLKFFASLREALATPEELLPYATHLHTVADLRAHLATRGGEWLRLTAMANLRCAVNQTMAHDATPLQPGDEVAFFPPVTGG